MTGKRPLTDWEAIEREFRAGQLSVSEIARQHSISHAAILQKAKRLGWERNLADRIKEAVTTKLVTDGVTGASAAETVALAAARGVQVVREHRDSIGRGQRVVAALFGELEYSDIALKDKSVVLGNLCGSLKTLIALERQAFNLGDGLSGDTQPEAITRVERVIVRPPNPDG